MSIPSVHIRNSISTKLLKTVFGLYFVVAVVVTMIQIVVEYFDEKALITKEVQRLEETFGPGLSSAMWVIDQNMLESVLLGMYQVPVVVGVKIVSSMQDGEFNKTIGVTQDSSGRIISEKQIPTGLLTNLFSGLFGHHFKLVYTDFDGSPIELGTVTIYSGQWVILERVKYGLFLILVNALIKTMALWIIFMYFGNRILGIPLTNLSRSVSQMQYEDLKPIQRVTKTGTKDELSLLELSFNQMIQRLRESKSAAHEAQAYLNRIIDSMPAILVGFDSDLRITHWNKAVAALTDRPIQHLGGEKVGKVFPAEMELLKLIEQMKRSKEPAKVQKIQLHRRGEAVYFDIVVFPLTNEPSHGVIIIEDVTTRFKMEQVLIQNEKMASLGGLSAGMAHEINNPLAGIAQNAQNISRRLTSNLALNRKAAEECGLDWNRLEQYLEKRRIANSLENIISACSRASKIINNMLKFSRASDLKRQDEDIELIISDSIELFNNEYSDDKKYDFREVDVKLIVQGDLPQIPCNKVEIEQVLFNLFKNAAQAQTDWNGKEPPVIRVVVSTFGEWIQIEVQDNGPGISDSVKKRIFEPFYTTKEVGVGTGLGLSVSYYIVTNNHEGTLTVESEPGKGAKFVIRLPTKVVETQHESA